MLLAAVTGSSTLLPLGAALLAVAGLVRWQRRRRGDAPRTVQTVRLTPQHALHVIDLDGRRLVVGTAPGAAPRLVESGPVPESMPQEPAWIRP